MANRNPKLADLESAENEQAPPAIPPGTQADVTVKFKTGVNPNLDNERPRARSMRDELADLAELAEDDDTAHPVAIQLDPLSQFCLDWRNYAGYLMKVTRLPDSGTRRMPGQTYNRTCLEIESLGSVPFDPNNLENTLQLINGNSGGVFRFFLVDENGYPVEHEDTPARVDRVAIGDPPKFGQDFERERFRDPRYATYAPQQQAPAPAPPQKSETEIELERIKSDLFSQVLQRAINPPPPPAITGLSGVSDEDRVGLLLLNQGGLLPALMTKLTALAQAPETITKEQGWKERGVEALFNVAQNNPAIIERVSGVIERIVNRVLPDPNAPVSVAPNLQQRPIQHAPGQRANAPLPAAPPTPAAWENPDHGAESEDDEESDPDVMDILDGMFELLTDTRPFVMDDPIIQELGRKYPVKFSAAMRLIATMPVDGIVDWISSQSSLYAALLNGVNGAHYRARLVELQAFCKAPPAPAQPSTLATDPDTQITSDVNDAEDNEVTSIG